MRSFRFVFHYFVEAKLNNSSSVISCPLIVANLQHSLQSLVLVSPTVVEHNRSIRGQRGLSERIHCSVIALNNEFVRYGMTAERDAGVNTRDVDARIIRADEK